MNVGNLETEYYNSVLEVTVSFLGIHRWEPDIYIGISLTTISINKNQKKNFRFYTGP
jgi:hypothetical protein